MQLAYVDSSVWIARVEGLLAYQKVIDGCLRGLQDAGYSLCTSEMIILEVLQKPYQAQDEQLINLYQRVFEQTKILENFPHLFKDALMVSQIERLRMVDALHVTFAVQYECKHFVSVDPHFKNLTLLSSILIDLTVV